MAVGGAYGQPICCVITRGDYEVAFNIPLVVSSDVACAANGLPSGVASQELGGFICAISRRDNPVCGGGEDGLIT